MIGAFVVLPSVVSTVVTVVGVSDQSIDQSLNLFVDMQKLNDIIKTSQNDKIILSNILCQKVKDQDEGLLGHTKFIRIIWS